MKNVITFTVKNNERFGGEANGYVAVPPKHPLHGLTYNQVEERYSIDVHGGFTLSAPVNTNPVLQAHAEQAGVPSDYWILGFDTCHLADNKKNWSIANVEKELKDVAEQVEKIK